MLGPRNRARGSGTKSGPRICYYTNVFHDFWEFWGNIFGKNQTNVEKRLYSSRSAGPDQGARGCAPQAQTPPITERALLASYPLTEAYPKRLWSRTLIWKSILLQSNSRAPTSFILNILRVTGTRAQRVWNPKGPNSLPEKITHYICIYIGVKRTKCAKHCYVCIKWDTNRWRGAILINFREVVQTCSDIANLI